MPASSPRKRGTTVTRAVTAVSDLPIREPPQLTLLLPGVRLHPSKTPSSQLMPRFARHLAARQTAARCHTWPCSPPGAHLLPPHEPAPRRSPPPPPPAFYRLSASIQIYSFSLSGDYPQWMEGPAADVPCPVSVPAPVCEGKMEDFINASPDHRDALLRLIQYACKLFGNVHALPPPKQTAMRNLASGIDVARAISRR